MGELALSPFRSVVHCGAGELTGRSGGLHSGCRWLSPIRTYDRWGLSRRLPEGARSAASSKEAALPAVICVPGAYLCTQKRSVARHAISAACALPGGAMVAPGVSTREP